MRPGASRVGTEWESGLAGQSELSSQMTAGLRRETRASAAAGVQFPALIGAGRQARLRTVTANSTGPRSATCDEMEQVEWKTSADLHFKLG